MTYTLVVGAAPADGAENFYRRLLDSATLVVAADAAGEWCSGLGRTPDLVVGDFDSALPGAEARLAASGSEVVRFPADKDVTDLELAITAAKDRDAGPIVVTAAFSRRLDHTLAAVGALVRAGAGARACEPGWSAWVCGPGNPVELDAPAGATFSVLGVGDATGVSVSGAAWPLKGEPLPALSGRGVSNLAAGGPLRVSVESGTLVVFLTDGRASGIY
jgi:thiamine pyrophosphokinase